MPFDILIVDDEADIRRQMAGILSDEGFEAREAADSAGVYAALAARRPALLVLDVWLNESEQDGLQILETVRRDHPDLPVVMISGHATIDMAVTATRMGAYDFISKPFRADLLLHTVNRALEDARLRRENSALRERAGEGEGAEHLQGDSAPARKVRALIAEIARTDSRVMILGRPGAGKTFAARLVHASSQRSRGPFLTLHCGAASAPELEAALFGKDAGGGSSRQVGLLEAAHRGTLLLDDVHEMPLALQAKLVPVLQRGWFHRGGGSEPVRSDVRILSASSRDMAALARTGNFREDLYYRLNVATLVIPALAERKADIPALADYLLRRLAAARGGGTRLQLTPQALAALQTHHWPGNIWELENVLQRLLIGRSGNAGAAVDAAAVAEALRAGEGQGLPGWASSVAQVMDQPLREARDAFEREYLLFHLSRFGGNVSRTAAFVGMDRAALHRKLRGLGVTGPDAPQVGAPPRQAEDTP